MHNFEMSYFFINIMRIQVFENIFSYKMFVYDLWVKVVGHEMPWSRVACKSTHCSPSKYRHQVNFVIFISEYFMQQIQTVKV